MIVQDLEDRVVNLTTDLETVSSVLVEHINEVGCLTLLCRANICCANCFETTHSLKPSLEAVVSSFSRHSTATLLHGSTNVNLLTYNTSYSF